MYAMEITVKSDPLVKEKEEHYLVKMLWGVSFQSYYSRLPFISLISCNSPQQSPVSAYQIWPKHIQSSHVFTMHVVRETETVVLTEIGRSEHTAEALVYRIGRLHIRKFVTC